MSLDLDNPVVEIGDQAGQLEAWRFAGVSDANTYRGRLYPEVAPVGAQATVTLHRDRDRGGSQIVAQGTSAALPGRVSLAAVGSSGLTASVYCRSNAATTGLTLWLWLASTQDLQEREDALLDWGLNTQPEEATLAAIHRATMRGFLLRLRDEYPTPSRAESLQRYPGTSPWVDPGRRGAVPVEVYYMWGLNVENNWELVGLQNPGDWREWAICHALSLVWRRRSRGADDPLEAKAEGYDRLAREEWSRVRAQIDTDYDATPDRPARTRSIRLGRG